MRLSKPIFEGDRMTKNLLLVATFVLFGCSAFAQESGAVAADQTEQHGEVQILSEEESHGCLNGVCSIDDEQDQDLEDIDVTISMVEITSPDAAIEKIQDKAVALKFLEITYKNLDLYVTAAQNAAAEIAPEVDLQTAVKKIDHALIDAQHQMVDSEKVELPEHVQRYVAQAILKAQEITMQELLNNQPKTVAEYINAIKFTCQLTFAAALNVISYFYEVSDEDLAPFVQNPFGEVVEQQEVIQHKVQKLDLVIDNTLPVVAPAA